MPNLLPYFLWEYLTGTKSSRRKLIWNLSYLSPDLNLTEVAQNELRRIVNKLVRDGAALE
jgi:hypothetical protein